MNTTTGTRVQHIKTGKIGTIEGTYTDYYGTLCIEVRWDGAKRRSNVLATSVKGA